MLYKCLCCGYIAIINILVSVVKRNLLCCFALISLKCFQIKRVDGCVVYYNSSYLLFMVLNPVYKIILFLLVTFNNLLIVLNKYDSGVRSHGHDVFLGIIIIRPVKIVSNSNNLHLPNSLKPGRVLTYVRKHTIVLEIIIFMPVKIIVSVEQWHLPTPVGHRREFTYLRITSIPPFFDCAAHSSTYNG